MREVTMYLRTTVSRIAPKIALLGAFFITGAIAFSPAAMAADKNGHGNRMYRVTITNATPGQPVAPSVFATHNGRFRLFELGPIPVEGEPEYPLYFGLATAAETGSPVPLVDEVAAAEGVWEAVALLTDRTPPVLLPGESNSTTISASARTRFFSAAGMLGATNDAFYSVRSIPLPKRKGQVVHVYGNAYDAGSEANLESSATIGALGATDDNPATGSGINENGEGYIHVHGGIHGVGGPDGLDPAVHDWRNPVVELTIERVR